MQISHASCAYETTMEGQLNTIPNGSVHVDLMMKMIEVVSMHTAWPVNTRRRPLVGAAAWR